MGKHDLILRERWEEENPGAGIAEKLSEFSKFEKQFLEQRKVFLWGVVMDESAERVVNRLLYLEAKEPGKDIQFFINSPGGMVT